MDLLLSLHLWTKVEFIQFSAKVSSDASNELPSQGSSAGRE